MRVTTVRWRFVPALWACLPFLLIATFAAGQQHEEPEPAASSQTSQTKAILAPARDKTAVPPTILEEMNSALESLVARVSPAVVQILVTGYGTASEGEHTNTALIVRQHAVGSGVIVDPAGYIITNAHVVEGAQRIRVTLPVSSEDIIPEGKRQMVDARLLGVHKETDLALLKIDATNLPSLSLAAPHSAHEGELVVAIGSPEGLQNSVTMGVVSAVARQANPQKPMLYIQTDAPINPGNSGGPLVGMDGSVLGINTFILTESGGSEGLGFAIPAGVVRFVYRSLRKYGHVHRIEIGAGTQEVTPTLAEGLGLSRSWGVIVDDVTPGSPGDSAGLKVEDILLTVDGRRVDTLPALSAALYLHPLNEILKVEVLRGNERKTLLIPAVEHRDQMDQLADATDPDKSLIPGLGILVIDLTDQLRSMVGNLRIPAGVIVVGRAADLILPDTGVQTADIIHSLNRTPIDSVQTLRSAVKALKPGDAVVLQVERDGGLLYLTFEMD